MKNRLFTIILRFHLISILGKYITLLPSNVKTHNIQTLMIFTQFDEMINSNFWTRKEYAMPFLILIATVWKCVHRKTNIKSFKVTSEMAQIINALHCCKALCSDSKYTLVFSGQYQPDELYQPNLLLIVYRYWKQNYLNHNYVKKCTLNI